MIGMMAAAAAGGILAAVPGIDISTIFDPGDEGDAWTFDAENSEGTVHGTPLGDVTGHVNSGVFTTKRGTPILSVAAQESVFFDGGLDSITYTTPSTFTSGTVVLGMRNTNTATHVIQTGADASNRWQLSNTSGDVMLAFAGTSNVTHGSAPYGDLIVTCEFNGASTNLYWDGVLVASGDSGGQSIDEVILGALWDGSFAGAFNLYRYLIVDKILSAGERATAESWVDEVMPS